MLYHLVYAALPFVALEMADRAGLAPTKATLLGLLCYFVAFGISVIFARQAPYGQRFSAWMLGGTLASVITQFA